MEERSSQLTDLTFDNNFNLHPIMGNEGEWGLNLMK